MYSRLLYVFSFLLTFYFLCSTMFAIKSVIFFCLLYRYVSGVTCHLMFSCNAYQASDYSVKKYCHDKLVKKRMQYTSYPISEISATSSCIHNISVRNYCYF